MMNELPWTSLKVPDSGYIIRRISSESWADAFWAVDYDGHYLFIVSLFGDQTATYDKSKLTITGISSRLENLPENKQQLVLVLERKANADIFYDLCRGIVPILERSRDSKELLLDIFRHLKRWRIFLSGKRNPLMSDMEQRGLFAELIFLEDLIQTSNNINIAVNAWKGPEKIQQDFLFSGKAVEVKSLFGFDRNTVRISSENQLETIENQLYLVAINLASTIDGHGTSLNQKIDDISRFLEPDSETRFLFLQKLKNYGYDPMPEYDRPEYRFETKYSWLVTEKFPKIVRGELPAGIVKVTYQLELDKIKNFECPYTDIFENL